MENEKSGTITGLKFVSKKDYKSKPIAASHEESPGLYAAEEKLAEALKDAASEYLKVVLARKSEKQNKNSIKAFIEENLFHLGIPTALEQIMISFDTEACLAACVHFLDNLAWKQQIKIENVEGELVVTYQD